MYIRVVVYEILEYIILGGFEVKGRNILRKEKLIILNVDENGYSDLVRWELSCF